MKVKGFLKDVGGASRVTKARLAAFARADSDPVTSDPIAEVAAAWHPGRLTLRVAQIRRASKTAKTVRFVRADGGELPYFYAGQFIALEFPLGDTVISRPYSISSAPYEARTPKGYVEITVRRSRGDGFMADYINDTLREGDTVTGTLGCGQFYFEPLRDSRRIVALAGGTGITPFASMAKEIAHGTLDVDLTVLFGSVSSDDIILKEELEACAGPHVRIVHVLSGEEPGWTGERGFLSAELIRKYSPDGASYFICGPQAMYTFLRGELKKLEVPARRVRFEVFGTPKDISRFEGFPQEEKEAVHRLTVVRGIREDVIPARASESLAVALERAGIRIETACRSGECGLCRTKVLSGRVFVCPEGDGRRAADKEFGYVHACSAYPVSDVKIKIPIL